MRTCFWIIGALTAMLAVSLAAQERKNDASAVAPAGVSFTETGQQLNRLAGRGVVLADFNGDGFLDAFVANQNTPDGQGHRVYFGDGHGRFTDSGQVLIDPSNLFGKPAVGDVNGDGKPDVVTGKTVWLNDGKGRFTAHPELIQMSEDGELSAVALADLNHDGSLDLFAIYEWKSIRVYLNDGKGHFRDTGQRLGSAFMRSVALGDVNGDGNIDAVTAGRRANSSDPCPNRVWLNDGRGNFTDSGQTFDEGMEHTHGVALGDLNGDGHPDIVLAIASAGLAGKVYFNDGKGHFHDSGQTLGHRWAQNEALGDLNGDGSLDVFFACGEPRSGTPNEVWLNDGKGKFHDSGLRLGQAFSDDVALGDLNGDGFLDAFVVNSRIVDGSRNPPVFGGAPAEIWLNTKSQVAFDYLGQPLPGSVPVVFAPGIVSTTDNEHSAPAFSPDGNEVFWFANRPPGPANKEWLHFARTMRRENGRWSAPRVSPFGNMPAFSPDGHRVYFFAPRPGSDAAQNNESTLDIWVAEKQGDAWSEPKCLKLVARYPELREAAMPRIARNGTLYFIGYAPGTKSNHGIYRSELVNGEYAKPQLLPRSINLPPSLNWAPFIAPDEGYLLFSSNRTGSFDDYGDLYISRRLADGSWTDPVSLGEPVNTPRQEVFPGLSPDGKYLFFCRDTPGHQNDVYWVSAASIPALRFITKPPQENPK